MLRNYLLIAFRTLRKHPGYTALNVVGLGIGIACFVLLVLYVRGETNYDRHHEKGERIYRYVAGDWAPTSPAVAPALEADFPNLVEHAVRFYRAFSPAPVRYEDRRHLEAGISFVEPEVFEVFTYPFVAGEPATALTRPGTVVLTESMARKYFAGEEALGKTLHLFDDGAPFEVTGVIEDLPPHTYYRFDFLLPFQTLEPQLGEFLENWGWSNFYTYVLLREGVPPGALEEALPAFFERHTGEAYEGGRLQPVADVYLHPQAEQEWFPTGNRQYVYLLATIAVFVLFIACVNFMNLTTARSTERAREVGLRKTLGARRRQLVGQFLGEACLLSAIALALGVGFVQLALPLFNAVAGKRLDLSFLSPAEVAGGALALVLVTGLVAGSFPSFFLSRFRPASMLRNEHAGRAAGAGLRKTLVVVQFTLSIGLFIAATLVYGQLRFMQSKALGFDQEQLVVLETPDYPAFKEAAQGVAGVEAVSGGNLVPGQSFDVWPLWAEGMAPDSAIGIRSIRVDFGYVETLGLEIARGRDFSEDRPADATEAYLLNEAAARMFAETLGWKDPVGRTLTFFDFDGVDGFNLRRTGPVIGVVRDFHFASLHQEIEPVVMHVVRDPGQAVVRIEAGAAAGTLARLEALWSRRFPDRPFAFSFVDAGIEAQYRAEAQLTRVLGVFTSLAFVIACLGLFGLATFAATQRKKEVGIRKALGASVASVVVLLSSDFLRLVLVAAVAAAPLSYLLMRRWLEDFAYRIEISWTVFVVSGLAALALALVTVSYHALRAALADPVDSLRYE